MEKLTGKDYMNMPVSMLVNHPDYSAHALRVVMAISKMTTKELENLPVVKGPSNAR